jgi:hypothetical protein
MEQRPLPCAHRAPRPPMPPMTTPTDLTALYTTAWPHHLDGAYRPLLSGTVARPTSDHGQTSAAGCFSSPYSELPTLSQIGFTAPSNVTRWWLQEGMGPHGYAPYFPYTYTTPRRVTPIVRHRMIGFSCHRPGRCRCRLWGWARCQHRRRYRAR